VHQVNDTFNAFVAEVTAIVDSRREEQAQGLERHDLLSRLINASDSGSAKDQLTTQESIANVHIFMLAGWETTAHAVAVTLMFLAMYPEHRTRWRRRRGRCSGRMRPPLRTTRWDSW
jgi:cytochrome P450